MDGTLRSGDMYSSIIEMDDVLLVSLTGFLLTNILSFMMKSKLVLAGFHFATE